MNNGDWDCIKDEINTTFLVHLLLYWLTTLKDPLISNDILKTLNDETLETSKITECVEKDVFETINYILQVFRKVGPIDDRFLRFQKQPWILHWRDLQSTSRIIEIH